MGTTPRDATRFPGDSIGDQLWALSQSGACVDGLHQVTFTIDFPTVTSAAVFLAELDELFPEHVQARVMEQTLDVTLPMGLDHGALVDTLADLADLADERCAQLMGWKV